MKLLITYLSIFIGVFGIVLLTDSWLAVIPIAILGGGYMHLGYMTAMEEIEAMFKKTFKEAGE